MTVPTVVGLPLLLVLGAALTYGGVMSGYFLADDLHLIGMVTERGFFPNWGEQPGGFLRPLVVASYLADFKAWGLSPFGFHLTNVAVHVANSWLVAVLAARLLRRMPLEGPGPFRTAPATLIAPLAGLLFLVLPCHSEPVSWIAGRPDVLAAMFLLAALLAYCRYMESGGRGYLVAAALGFALALSSKESAIALPAVMVALAPVYIDRTDTRRQVRRLAAMLGAMMVVVPPYLAVRHHITGALVGGYGTSAHASVNVWAVPTRLLRYSVRAFSPPWSPEFYESLLRYRAELLFGVAVAAALLAAGAVHLFWGSARRKHVRMVGALLAAFYAALLPAMTHVYVSYVDTQGERFLYFPSVFACLATMYVLLVVMPWERRVGVGLALGVILVSGVNLYRVNRGWREAGVLVREIIESEAARSPSGRLVLVNLPDNMRGAYLFRNGAKQAFSIFRTTARSQSVVLLSTHSIRSTADRVSVSCDREAPPTCVVRVQAARSTFNQFFEHPVSVMESKSDKGFSFRLRGADDARVVVYSHGALHELGREVTP